MTFYDFVFFGLYGLLMFALIIYNIESKHAETQAIILEYQSKLTAVETEKQKTIAEFLRSVKTGKDNR